MRAPLRVGLTGGIASGKSTVAAMLVAHGAALIDTDRIARELTAVGGAGIAPLRAAFGDGVIDAHGALDRAALRARVFRDPPERLRLEALLHPLIRDRCLALARALDPAVPVVLFDIPLLAETRAFGQALALERILVVDCPASVQRAHARSRASMPDDQVQAAIDSQAGRAERLAIADDILVNCGSLESLAPRVERLWHLYKGAVPL